MYSIYLVENITTPSATPLYSGTNNINVTPANTINLLSIDNTLSLEIGQYFKFKGEYYSIVSFSYSAGSRSYQIKVTGNPEEVYDVASGWSIHSVTKETNQILLDTEDIEIETTFAVADVADISKRKDTLTKNIAIKGTETNNKAFGHLFFLNRNVDLRKSNKLFFNYSSLRSVDCLVYEESILILRGNMLITDWSVDKMGNITYNATITGKFIDFKAALGESLMTDLNLIDLKHQFHPLNIGDSWGGKIVSPPPGYTSVGLGRTQRYNPSTGTYYYQAYQPGSGYVYPFIDYGDKFQNDLYNLDYSWIKLQNHRPALFVREYFNRIFSKLGYTYELKGSADMIERFDHLIVPNTEEKFMDNDNANPSEYRFTSPFSTYPLSHPLALVFTQDHASNRIDTIDDMLLVHPLRMPTTIGSPKLTSYGPEFGTLNRTNNIIQCNRNFTTDGYVKVKIRSIYNDSSTHDSQICVQLVKRAFSTDDMDVKEWDVLAQDSFTIGTKVTIKEKTIEFYVPNTDFEAGEQLMVRLTQSIGVTWIGYVGSPFYTINSCQFYISEVVLRLPKNVSGSEYYSYEVSEDDYVTPKAPAEWKQFDFIKTILTMMNLYVDNDPVNPKHFILQSYDDFYAFTSPSLLKSNSLNWTNKIDYDKGLKFKGNLFIPKNYTFTYKDDADFINKTYKDRFNETYATLKFTDAYGMTDAQKVELSVSPSPQVEIGNSKRYYPIFAKDGITLSQKKAGKVNPRILYYNGVRQTTLYGFREDSLRSDGTWIVKGTYSATWYGLASMYWYDKSTRNKIGSYTSDYTPLHSLNFGNPKEYYFNATGAYNNVPNLYSEFYIGQISELTNPNVSTLICEVKLTENEIGSLDFRVPVFIDTGSIGDSYFKILSIDYSNNKRTSTVTLQKIV